MKESISEKIKTCFPGLAMYKRPDDQNLFGGRKLPSFVRDYLLRRFRHDEEIDKDGLTLFLDKIIPAKSESVKDRLASNEELTVLARFTVNINLVKGIRQFAIPDMGIKYNEALIPQRLVKNHPGELDEGEKWGILKLCVLPDANGKNQHVEMIDYKPFKPFTSVDLSIWRAARNNFSFDEWLDLLISAMDYNPDAFPSRQTKLEMLTRLLIFAEPQLNVIELAPKGTGKSYVFGNLSKYGWLVSGGKVTRAKLFYDKQKQQNGIIKNHDFVAFDEIQTIVFQEPAEIQAALKAYLESGKTTIDNFELSSSCGLMLMGNINLTESRRPVSSFYFANLPQAFRESALLDRFHCFINGWLLPRINKNMIYSGWTINTEYFSEILHALRTENAYAALFDQLIDYQPDADLRDFKAVKKIASAYLKLLFPHWTSTENVQLNDFNQYCLQPAIERRGIIKKQCSIIDPEFKPAMPHITCKL